MCFDRYRCHARRYKRISRDREALLSAPRIRLWCEDDVVSDVGLSKHE